MNRWTFMSTNLKWPIPFHGLSMRQTSANNPKGIGLSKLPWDMFCIKTRRSSQEVGWWSLCSYTKSRYTRKPNRSLLWWLMAQFSSIPMVSQLWTQGRKKTLHFFKAVFFIPCTATFNSKPYATSVFTPVNAVHAYTYHLAAEPMQRTWWGAGSGQFRWKGKS